MANIIRHANNHGNKTLARQFREATIRPIKSIGARHKPAYRAQRSDFGKKRT